MRRWLVAEDNVADFGTKALNRSVMMKHAITLGFVKMTEEVIELVQLVDKQEIRSTCLGRVSGQPACRAQTVTMPRRVHDD